MPMNEESLTETLARLDGLAAQRTPQPAQIESVETTGLMRWVRALYTKIEALRAAGFSWREIADMLTEAEISLKCGSWTADKLRAAVARERHRRSRH